MRKKIVLILFLMITVSVLLIPVIAAAEAEKPVIDLEIGKTTEGALKDGKTKLYEIEPTCNGLLTITIKCYVKDELHTSLYPKGKSDPYPRITKYNEAKGYSLTEYKAYVGARKYRLELSNPTIIFSGSYRIHTEFTPIYTADDGMNNSKKQAVLIRNHSYYPGVLAYDETDDYYSIKLTKRSQLQLKVTCIEKTWLDIIIKNSSGETVDKGRAYHNTIPYKFDQKLAAGTYTIIISTNGKDGLYGRRYGIETGNYIPITKIDLPASKKLKLGDIYSFKPTLKPSDSKAACYYVSSDPKVVRITLDGRATAIRKGKATITARPYDGKAKDTCIVTVEDTSVQKITLNKSKLTLTLGESYTLKATVSPKSATGYEQFWESSNKEVATVNSTGKVKAKGTGTCKITVKLDGKTATATITVMKKTEPTTKPKPTATPTVTPTPTPIPAKPPAIVPVEGISMTNSLELSVGETKELVVNFTPENATNKALIWTCSDNSIVTVTNGKVTGSKVGIATVIVTSVNGKRTFCKIEVTE